MKIALQQTVNADEIAGILKAELTNRLDLGVEFNPIDDKQCSVKLYIANGVICADLIINVETDLIRLLPKRDVLKILEDQYNDRT